MKFKDYIIVSLLAVVVALGIWLSIEIQPQEFNVDRSVDSTQTTRIDTVYADTTERTLEPDSIPNADDVYSDTLVVTKTDTFKAEPNNELSKIRQYSTSVGDSLLTGTIETTVQGYLVTQNFTYTPQYPLQVTIDTKTMVTETITKTLEPKPYPSVGLRGVSDFKTSHGFEITASWTRQNGNRFTYGYNPIQKSHSIGISYNLRNLFK